MAKVLIKEDSRVVENVTAQLSEIKFVLDNIKARYEAPELALGAFTDEKFKYLLNNLVHTLLPDNLSKEQFETACLLNEDIRSLKAILQTKTDNGGPTLDIDWVSFSNGEFVVDKTEEIAERYARTYVDADAKLSLESTLSSLIEGLSNLKDQAIILGLTSTGLVDPLGIGLLNKFVVVDASGNLSVSTEGVNWALTYKQ